MHDFGSFSLKKSAFLAEFSRNIFRMSYNIQQVRVSFHADSLDPLLTLWWPHLLIVKPFPESCLSYFFSKLIITWLNLILSLKQKQFISGRAQRRQMERKMPWMYWGRMRLPAPESSRTSSWAHVLGSFELAICIFDLHPVHLTSDYLWMNSFKSHGFI